MNIVFLKSITRKQFLKWFGWGSVGWITAMLAQGIVKEQAPVNMNLETFEFEVKKVDVQGEVREQEKRQGKFFSQDLGNSVTLEMVYLPGGSFLMGTEEEEIERLVKKFNWEGFRSEKPQHEVKIQPFFLGKYPVTQEQWKAISSLPKVNRDLEAEPSYFKGDKRPVEKVAWEDAVEFCQRLSFQTGKEYRLPSEAEWEYACRAGTTSPFNLGETITEELVNYDGREIYGNEPRGEYREETTPVGSFSANAYGLYDLHGNVWEWCEDDWHENYQAAPTDGSAWKLGASSIKVVRGGSWLNAPPDCRCAYRFDLASNYRSYFIGFRVAYVASEVAQTSAILPLKMLALVPRLGRLVRN